MSTAMSSETSPFLFLEMLERVKQTKRAGWIRRELGVPTESVADHMYRTAIMCCMAPGFDEQTRIRATLMALVHDMSESITGDITPFDGINPEEKKLREDLATKFLVCTVRPCSPHFADLLSQLWHEYEAGDTRASQLVHQIDKMECMDQAFLYEKRSGEDLEEFMALQKHVTLPELQPWLSTLLQEYKEKKSGKKTENTFVFVSGGPGVGKGTQCTLAADEFDFHHICVGDLLREESASTGSLYGDLIKESIEKSVLLPATLTTYLLGQEIRRACAQGKRRFLLDGFPRSLDQATDFHVKISDCYSTISFVCSEDVMQERLEQRAEMSNRSDDNRDIVSRRIHTFKENNAPVLEYLRRHGPVYDIDCSRTVRDIYSSVQSTIRQILHTN